MFPLKNPLSYQEQIDNLRHNHSLIINDENEAEYILSRVNYYRLSAYGIGLKDPTNRELYRPGVSLEHIYRLYCFDSKMRVLLTSIIEYLEVEFRTKVSYHLAMTYGPEGFRDANNFTPAVTRNNESIHQKTMDKFDKEVQLRRNLPCVVHHQTKYGGHFPVWAAVELFTFGMLSSIYSIMKSTDQVAVAKEYATVPRRLNSWLLSLVEVRNICAHYGRLYNMPLKQTPKLYKEFQQYQGNRLFSVILVIKRMTNGASVWVNFLTELRALLGEYTEVNLSFIGFPPNWSDLL